MFVLLEIKKVPLPYRPLSRRPRRPACTGRHLLFTGLGRRYLRTNRGAWGAGLYHLSQQVGNDPQLGFVEAVDFFSGAAPADPGARGVVSTSSTRVGSVHRCMVPVSIIPGHQVAYAFAQGLVPRGEGFRGGHGFKVSSSAMQRCRAVAWLVVWFFG